MTTTSTTSSPPDSSSPTTTSLTRRVPIFLGLFFLISIFLIFFVTDTFPGSAQIIDAIYFQAQWVPHPNEVEPPTWFEVARGNYTRPPRVGILNVEKASVVESLKGLVDSTVTINLEHVSPNVTWDELFPQWVHNDSLGGCPRVPMPEPGKYLGLDMIVAQLPCRQIHELEKNDENYTNNNETTHMEKGMRDVPMLQLSLATARLIVENDAKGDAQKGIYAVFMGKCEPMAEIFRCDDLVWRQGEYWVYKPNVAKLRELITMPVGSCDLAHPYAHAPDADNGQLETRPNDNEVPQRNQATSSNNQHRPRHAYVSVLHSSNKYVCGAIALAQSLRRTNTTKDLVLLAGNSISNHSIIGLQAAGWKVKRMERIPSPYAKNYAYNKWNYSKLRVWQLIQYDKVMFIDSDFIVLSNIDHFFHYPQLSAAPDADPVFNSGILILEPSKCFFDMLMRKRYTIKSYNGGDQGYLNEVVTWWHRLTIRLNFLKMFQANDTARNVIGKPYTIHFLGLKPWMCYRDYDCNWDSEIYQRFASDDVFATWWRVYDVMSGELQAYCGMTKEMDTNLRIRRDKAQKANFTGGHWKIEIKDPRQFQLVT